MRTPDDRVQQWIDALLDRSRTQLRAELDAFARALEEEASARRDVVAEEARAGAEAAALARTSTAVSAEREAAAERQAAALAEAGRAAAAAQAHALEALRTELDEGRTSAIDELEARAERDLASAVVSWRATEREAEMALASALVDGIRALDQADSLSGTLDTLVTAAAVHAPRVALVVAREGTLRGWQWRGFEGDASACTIAPDATGPVAEAYRTRSARVSTDAAQDGRPLAPSHPGRAAVAVPLEIDRRAVAVLYADDDGSERGRSRARSPRSWRCSHGTRPGVSR